MRARSSCTVGGLAPKRSSGIARLQAVSLDTEAAGNPDCLRNPQPWIRT